MDVLDAANTYISGIIKVFLIGVHDDGSRNDAEESIGSWEITLKMLNITLDCVLLQRDDHLCKN